MLTKTPFGDSSRGLLESSLMKRDATDFEWTEFRNNSLTQIFIMLIYSITGSYLGSKFPNRKRVYYPVAGAFLVLFMTSYQGIAFLFATILIFYALIKLRNQKIMWFLILIFLACFHSDTYREYLFSFFGIENSYRFIAYVAILMTVLRVLSYGTETFKSTSYSFSDYACYIFYYPLFFQGPLLTFDLFIKDFNEPRARNNMKIRQEILRCLIMTFAIDLYYHYSFVNALSAHHNILKMLNETEAMALGWPLIILFCVKYKIFYGLASIFTMIDGIESPAAPKCVCTLYTFIDMWRYFDQGLYRLLQRSIYIQIGGSHQGYMKTLIASFSCFGFVALWHGNNNQYWYWGLLNWLGICVEHCIAKIMKSEKGMQFKSMIGLANYRRVIGLSGSVAIFSLIYSNLVFVTSIESANLIYQQIMSQWYSFAIVLATFYFGVHFIIDLQ